MNGLLILSLLLIAGTAVAYQAGKGNAQVRKVARVVGLAGAALFAVWAAAVILKLVVALLPLVALGVIGFGAYLWWRQSRRASNRNTENTNQS